MYIRKYDKSTDQEIFIKIDETDIIKFVDILEDCTVNGIIERQKDSENKSYRLE